jgi:hypothetical protein
VLAGVLAFLLLRPGPVLLDPADFAGVERTVQGSPEQPPGWTGCDIGENPVIEQGSPDTFLKFEDGTSVVAAIAETWPTGSSSTVHDYAAYLSGRAERCGQPPKTGHGFTIEPLPRLAEGEVGWRTGYADPLWWGQYLLIPLDEERMLLVGFETREPEPPFDWDRLVELARHGAEQFPAAD